MKTDTPFDRLRVAAENLNNVTDAFNAAITGLEGKLKQLNLGVEAQVKIPVTEHSQYVGYGRLPAGHGWGLYLVEDERCWPYNDAPRRLRVDAAVYLPQLLEALSKEVDDLLKRVVDANVTGEQVLKALGLVEGKEG